MKLSFEKEGEKKTSSSKQKLIEFQPIYHPLRNFQKKYIVER